MTLFVIHIILNHHIHHVDSNFRVILIASKYLTRLVTIFHSCVKSAPYVCLSAAVIFIAHKARCSRNNDLCRVINAMSLVAAACDTQYNVQNLPLYLFFYTNVIKKYACLVSLFVMDIIKKYSIVFKNSYNRTMFRCH